MSFRISVLPPSPALAQDVVGYVVRRRDPDAGAAQTFTTRFPANMYAALTIVHRGRLVDPESKQASHPASLSGAMTRDAQREYHDTPETTVVLLRPGRMTDLCRVPAHELTDRWIATDDIFTGAEHREITDRMVSQTSVARELHVLESVLERRLRRSGGSRASALSHMVQRLVWRLPHMTVRELADHAGMSERQLHRQCLQVFGVAPKALIRLARLQLSLWQLQAMAKRETASLASVAQAAGFADQAHMAKDFRALLGQSPAWLRDRLKRSLPSEWAFELPQDLLNPHGSLAT